jgi:translation initiation factor 6
MHALVTDFNGIANIGLYAFVNDKFALVGRDVPERIVEQIKEVFQVPVHIVSMAGTSLIGVFVTGNNNKILIPGIVFEHEKEELERLGIDYEVFNTRYTGLGNNIIMGESKALVSPEYTEIEVKRISELMDVEAERVVFKDVNTIGNLAVINIKRKKALISNDLSQEEHRHIEKTFNVKATTGSVNMGSPYIKAGVLVNSHGFAMGSSSGGPELANADEALGFLEDE